MVMHEIQVRGVNLAGVTQAKPVLLQINDDEFPKAFLQELSAIPTPTATTPGVLQVATQPVGPRRIIHLPTMPATPVTLYQPVQRVTHLVLVQLCCESVGFPRLDPKRVISAGLVMRRVPLNNGNSNLSGEPSPWIRNAAGQFSWIAGSSSHADDDPDPTMRPLPLTGQPALDQMLGAKALSVANTEIYTPAFVAAPDVCNAAQRTLVYAVVPTASSEASSQLPAPPVYQDGPLLTALPTLLKAGPHCSPQAGNSVNYQYMSDEYAKANGASDFLIFSSTLRMMYSVFGAFDGGNNAQNLLEILNARSVTVAADDGSGPQQMPMGAFYQKAASYLIDYDPNDATQTEHSLNMPTAWDYLTGSDQSAILGVLKNLLAERSALTLTPQGRFQDARRLYRLRLFFRIKSEHPNCPPKLVWSCLSDPFRIAAWHESSGRVVPPVVLPDPTDPSVLATLKKPNSSFAVPAGLMNAMQGTTLTGLSSGAGGGGGAGGGIQLNWICGFSIPLISICAFFVLNIFLSLLNIVFFWMAFIKICIPFPFTPPPGTTTGSEP